MYNIVLSSWEKFVEKSFDYFVTTTTILFNCPYFIFRRDHYTWTKYLIIFFVHHYFRMHFYQCTYFSQRGIVSGRFFINFNFSLVIAITLWLIWVVLQIRDELYSVTYSELFFAWLVIKAILLALVFQFNYVVDESRRITNRDNLIKELKITLAENSVIKTVLYNFPTFLEEVLSNCPNY